jgi:hypothetical protein
MALVTNGTPFVGYVQLTNAAAGPIPFGLTVNGAPYVVPATERLYITNLTVSSGDPTQALVTVDDGPANARKLVSAYVGAAQPPATETIPPGVCRLAFGQTPRATASAVTSGATIECTIAGFLSRT